MEKFLHALLKSNFLIHTKIEIRILREGIRQSIKVFTALGRADPSKIVVGKQIGNLVRMLLSLDIYGPENLV